MGNMNLATLTTLKERIAKEYPSKDPSKAVSYVKELAIKTLLASSVEDTKRIIFLLKSPLDNYNFGGLRCLGKSQSFASAYLNVANEIGAMFEELSEKEKSDLEMELGTATNISVSKPKTAMQIAFENAGYQPESKESEVEHTVSEDADTGASKMPIIEDNAPAVPKEPIVDYEEKVKTTIASLLAMSDLCIRLSKTLMALLGLQD